MQKCSHFPFWSAGKRQLGWQGDTGWHGGTFLLFTGRKLLLTQGRNCNGNCLYACCGSMLFTVKLTGICSARLWVTGFGCIQGEWLLKLGVYGETLTQQGKTVLSTGNIFAVYGDLWAYLSEASRFQVALRRVPGAEYPNKSVLVPVVRIQEATAVFFNGCTVQTSHDFAQVVVFLMIPRNKIGYVLCKWVKMNNCRPCMERIDSSRERDIWRRNGVAHSNTTKWAIFSKTKSSKQTFCCTKVKRKGG